MSPERDSDEFDKFWLQGAWPSGPVAERRFDWMRSALEDRRYDAALEIGCGDGGFTKRLVEIARRVVAVDVSREAVARAAGALGGRAEFHRADVVDFDLHAGGPWDLVVMSEVLPYIGWRHTFFEVGWLASEIFAVTRPGGRLAVVDTEAGVEDDWLYRPWLIRTYHDLFANVGFEVERSERFEGDSDGVRLRVLLSLFGKPLSGA
jgi:SAM-dependent methyltransferase